MQNCNHIKKLFIAATMLAVTGCASTHITQEISTQGCWSGVDAVERTNKTNEEVRRAQIKTHWDGDCAQFEKREAVKDMHYRVILARAQVEIGSPQQETEATRQMLAVISHDNPDLFVASSELGKAGVTVEDLLQREVSSLLTRIVSTHDVNDAQEARGELISIYDDVRYPMHTDVARPIIDTALLQEGVELQAIRDQYLGKAEPDLKCENVNGALICAYK